ncbi:anti-sigma factor [Rugamonas sp.]|uniref:anti-sigma factor n=1 Tax=Rugamonas sp. TaxID=1926287 RepID=UPI0025E2ED52|nr:anti-sigma factor [Rugamonas sp.]
MNIRDKPTLREKLAAEYVIGTLKGGARRRFEGWMHNDAALRRTTAEWQDRLTPLAEFAGAQRPRKQVWQSIERRLNLRPAARVWEFWRNESVTFWRSLGVASTALATLLVVVLGSRALEAPTINYVATLTDEKSQSAMVLTADNAHHQLEARVLSGVSVADDKTLQLWAIPAKGAPRSLGIVADNHNARLTLPANAIGGDVTLIAVTLEPKGGSRDPHGGPSGPVVYKGNWIRLM